MDIKHQFFTLTVACDINHKVKIELQLEFEDFGGTQ